MMSEKSLETAKRNCEHLLGELAAEEDRSRKLRGIVERMTATIDEQNDLIASLRARITELVERCATG